MNFSTANARNQLRLAGWEGKNFIINGREITPRVRATANALMILLSDQLSTEKKAQVVRLFVESCGGFREMDEDGRSVQLVLPLLEVSSWSRMAETSWLGEAGLRLMRLVMEEEAERLIGPRRQQDEEGSSYR